MSYIFCEIKMVKNLAQTVKSSPGTANFEMVIPVMEAVGPTAANFEVIIPEAVGSEECVTLHYSLEDGNLFDEMVASQSLLLLSESGEQEEGIIFYVMALGGLHSLFYINNSQSLLIVFVHWTQLLGH